jgi:AcrR family transcriptional regulator
MTERKNRTQAMGRPRGRRSADATREKILQKATVRFSKYSYEQVSLRDIARDARVDVALVHRSFGSKQSLFSKAFASAVEKDRASDGGARNLATRFADELFEKGGTAAARSATSWQIFVRSLASPEALSILRSHASENLILPLAEVLGGPQAAQRAALFSAFLVGVRIMRDMLGVEPLSGEAGAESRDLIAHILHTCLSGDLA